MNCSLRRVASAIGATLLTIVTTTAVGQTAATGIPGPNVNIIGPTPDPAQVPDKTFKQQNEPSCAVQPANPQNIFCAYNDYRGVDIATIGDAWIGASITRNGGDTWTSRLVPGFPGDASAYGYAFAADATTAAAPGLALLGLMAAGRDPNSPGGMLLQRWTEENKEDGAPWAYLDTKPILSGTSGQFLDKPAMLVTLSGTTPVLTALTATVSRNLVPAVIHVAYANFSGNDTNDSASIYYTRSTDYGKTWSNKNKLSESIALNQGVALAANGNKMLAVWRQFDKNSNQPDSFAYAVSTNAGIGWSKPATVPLPANSICPFDQPSQLPESNYAFRAKSLPTLVSDGRRFYLFWAKRTSDGNNVTDCVRGRSRIVYLSTDGTSWDSTPGFVDNRQYDDQASQVLGQARNYLSHQFMPSAFAAGGVIQVAWYDTRDDEYFQTGEANTYSPYVVDDAVAGRAINRRHTADVYHAQIVGGTAATAGQPRGSVKVSQYAVGVRPGTIDRDTQLEHNFVNGRLFKKATKPFMGDYNSVAAPAFRLEDGQWISNQAAVPGTTAEPTFVTAWADNRDVRGNVYTQSTCLAGAIPGSTDCPQSSEYRPADTDVPKLLGEEGSGAYPAGQKCERDFGQPPVPPAQPDEDYWLAYRAYVESLKWGNGSQVSFKALSRNQNVYASVIKPGVVVGIASAFKPTDIQRAFVVYLQNALDSGNQTFVLKVSPVYSSPPASTSGDWVSFTQKLVGSTTQDRWLPVTVPQGSLVARTVFVQSTSPIQARVDVFNASSCSALDTSSGIDPVCTTPVNSVVLNGNPTADALKNPDCFGKQTCPDVLVYEAHIPELAFDVYSVDYGTETPSLRNPSLRNPSLRNSVYESPSLRNETVEFPSLRNPSLRNSPITDDAAPEAQQFTDFVYDMENTGNTTSAYDLKPLITGDLVDADGNPLVPQLIVSRVYEEETAQNCDTATIDRQQVLVSIPYPDVGPTTISDPLADPGLAANDRHATFFAEPGGKLQVTLRIWGIDAVTTNPEFVKRVYMKIYAQAADSNTVQGFDVIGCPAGQAQCTPDVTKPVFQPNPDPHFLNVGQPANVYYTVANGPGGWKPDPGFTGPSVVDESAVTVVCVDKATGVDITNLTKAIPVGPAAVVCTATDAAGNKAVSPVEYQFFVLDDVAPALGAVPSPIVADAVDGTGAVVTYASPTADDLVNGPVPVSCTPASGSTFAIGTTTVTCTASDGPPYEISAGVFTNNQVGSATFTVTVGDRAAPTVTVPASITANTDAGKNFATVNYLAQVSATDNVAVTSLVCTPSSGSAFAAGATIVSCTATDAAGNSTTRTFTVTVSDAEKPVLTVPANLTVTTSGTTATVSYTVTATDNVGLAAGSPGCTSTSPGVSGVTKTGGTFPVGTSTVTCTATDTAVPANVTTKSFTVTVNKLGYSGLDGIYANGSKSVNSSVPLDFGFTGVSGRRVDSSLAQPVVTVYLSGAKTCGATQGTLVASYPGSSDYRYSASSLNWQFNWKTTGLATGCYKLTVTSAQTGQVFASKNTVTLTK
jgi:hypothetical protein